VDLQSGKIQNTEKGRKGHESGKWSETENEERAGLGLLSAHKSWLRKSDCYSGETHHCAIVNLSQAAIVQS